ncbi:hypothetical protein OY671_009094, partial [Metschnikowia pulcherrima]
EMVHDVSTAFAARDPVAAAEIVARDATVDAFYDSVFRNFVSFMVENPATITSVAQSLRAFATCSSWRFTVSAPKSLSVEDDTALAESVEYRFRGEGYDVRTTDDGDEASLLAAEDTPDSVSSDWMIGGTSGIEVCRRSRRNKSTAHVPIIMLTARSDEDDRVRGSDTGADDYVTKP